MYLFFFFVFSFFFFMVKKLCLAHFCEIHGPTSIVVTQAVGSVNLNNNCVSSISTQAGGPEVVGPGASTSLNSNNSTSTTGSLANSTSSIGSNVNKGGDNYCNSCRFRVPHKDDVTRLRTIATNGTTYLSTQAPVESADAAVLKQAYLQLLSSEHTFNDSTPIMVSSSGGSSGSGSSSNGFAYMGLVFKIRDDSSRGHVRKYALIALAETDLALMRDWTFLVNQFNRIRTWMVKSPETAATGGAATAPDAAAAAGAGFTANLASDHAGTTTAAYASPPSLFLRSKRDASSSTQSQTLPELMKNAAFFQELHGKFTAILAGLDKKYNSPLNSF